MRTWRPRLERSGLRPSGERLRIARARCARRRRGEPRGKKAKAAGQTSSYCLEDEESEEESSAPATGRRVISFGPNGGAEGATDGEIPSFGMPGAAGWELCGRGLDQKGQAEQGKEGGHNRQEHAAARGRAFP